MLSIVSTWEAVSTWETLSTSETVENWPSVPGTLRRGAETRVRPRQVR